MKRRRSRLPGQQHLHDLFAGPTFDALKRHGGQLDTEHLRGEISEALKGALSKKDWEPYKRGRNEPIWWNDIRAQAIRWRSRHFMEDSTFDRVWRITDKGLRELEELRARFVTSRRITPTSTGWILTGE
ncbi:MAG TPA: hypothetical protein VMT64_16735, partial [Candidatus Binataceae bacterium]|nr:hypothetical protein [Candidatus Binataceae bacterium]